MSISIVPPTIDVDGHAFVLFGRESADGKIQHYVWDVRPDRAQQEQVEPAPEPVL